MSTINQFLVIIFQFKHKMLLETLANRMRISTFEWSSLNPTNLVYACNTYLIKLMRYYVRCIYRVMEFGFMWMLPTLAAHVFVQNYATTLMALRKLTHSIWMHISGFWLALIAQYFGLRYAVVLTSLSYMLLC
mgnify:CR=1 FL=1